VSTPAELWEIKRRLSDRLLQIPGVAGLGTPAGRLTVYLEQDSLGLPGKGRCLSGAPRPLERRWTSLSLACCDQVETPVAL
jgi:hypothetical protein